MRSAIAKAAKMGTAIAYRRVAAQKDGNSNPPRRMATETAPAISDEADERRDRDAVGTHGDEANATGRGPPPSPSGVRPPLLGQTQGRRACARPERPMSASTRIVGGPVRGSGGSRSYT